MLCNYKQRNKYKDGWNLWSHPSLLENNLICFEMEGKELFLTYMNIDQGEWYCVMSSTGYMGWVNGKYYQPLYL